MFESELGHLICSCPAQGRTPASWADKKPLAVITLASDLRVGPNQVSGLPALQSP